MDITIASWRRIAVRERFDAAILDVKRVECASSSGKSGVFTIVGARDWAVVVAILGTGDDRRCLMVRQYRHGAEGFFLEFPGGVIEKGEDPVAGVERELEEETGWKAGRIVLAGTVSPNPAFLENRFHVFVAFDLEPLGRQSFDEHEEVEVVELSLADLRARMGRGELANAMMVTGLYLAERVLAAE